MSDSDFWFACEGLTSSLGPWETLKVVTLDGAEEMSRLASYELRLLAPKGVEGPDPIDLVGKRASIRIRTFSEPPFRVIHGVVVEAEDVDELPEGSLYRLVLAPPWVRAAHRSGSRIFLEKSLRQIVDAVLGGDKRLSLTAGAEVQPDLGSPGFAPAHEKYTWRISDASRVDDMRVRAYTVQYAESDFAFVSRLLEDEGIAHHYEHGDETCLLVLSDSDAGRARVGHVGSNLAGRRMDTFGVGGRLRAGTVVFDDYNWKKPSLPLEAESKSNADRSLEARYYPGGFPDSGAQGELLASAVADRNQIEAAPAFGEGTVRVLGAGSIFELEHSKERLAGEYLVTAATLHGEQSGVLSGESGSHLFQNVPFRVDVTCARRGRGAAVAESRFRPARATPRPRIRGAQTAFVTAEGTGSSAEVHVSGPDGLDVGCVRVKFHWDAEHGRHAKQPTSTWIRVNEPFAGPGQGGVWHPQVGTEVIVEFEEGDPDRPIVTGRVYNGANLPSHGGIPNVSTLKSFSTPGHGVHNEMTFDDTAGSELFYVNAGKDMTSDVGNDRTETVAVHTTMQVGSDNTETIGANNTDSIGANDSMVVGANQVKSVGANRTRAVAANRTKLVGASEIRLVGGNFESTVSASLTETTGGAVTETYSATKTMSVGASLDLTCGGSKTSKVSGPVVQMYGGNHDITAGGARTITVNGMEGTLVGGGITNNYGTWNRHIAGPMIGLVGGGVTHHVAGDLSINAPLNLKLIVLDVTAYGDHTHATGINTSITGVSLAVTGAQYTVTGESVNATGLSVGTHGANFWDNPLHESMHGLDLRIGGIHIFV